MCGALAALAFPTFEFSMCKRIPLEGCRSAGTEGFEPPTDPVLETGALPIELDPYAVVPPKRNRPARASVLGAVSACGLLSAT
jgi:hypothetical protein